MIKINKKRANELKNETSARAKLVNCPISFKDAMIISDHLRYRKLDEAIKVLEDVLKFKVAIPYRKFNDSRGHRKNIGPGRYPIKPSKDILKVLKQARANAINKGLDENILVIHQMITNKGESAMRYGRKFGQEAKRAHVEVIVCEDEKMGTRKENKSKPKEKPAEKKKQGEK